VANLTLTTQNTKDEGMEKMLYLAAQYLAAAAISFLEKKEDDSHTNLRFNVENANLYSRPLNMMGDTLSLDYVNFALNWNSGDNPDSFSLDGRTHAEVLIWLADIFSAANFDTPYNYAFHYDFPYSVDNDFKFRLSGLERLKELTHFRVLAQLVMEKFLRTNQLDSEIRIWPHHFDTGANVTLENKKEMAVGFGLAVPDSLLNEHYFYISGNQGNGAMETSGFPSLTHGEWYSADFKGAVLPAVNMNEKEVLAFFSEALMQYKSHSLR
jgi:hypothetical protein